MTDPTTQRVSEERLAELIAIAEFRRIDGSDWKPEMATALRELQHLRSQLPAPAASYSHATPASVHGYGQPEAAERSETGSAARDAARYRYMKRICRGLKGVIDVRHVVGTKDILIMAVSSDYADEFIDKAIAAEREGK